MKPYTIYLAGPITGCSYTGCTNWRETFQSLLSAELVRHGRHPHRIQCLSPLRGKEYLEGEESIKDTYPHLHLSCDRGIMTRDYRDCTQCDLVVANFVGATRVSIGTVMEMAWAFSKRIPTIVVMEPKNNLHDHSMIRESADYRLDTLLEAAKTAFYILYPPQEPALAAAA